MSMQSDQVNMADKTHNEQIREICGLLRAAYSLHQSGYTTENILDMIDIDTALRVIPDTGPNLLTTLDGKLTLRTRLDDNTSGRNIYYVFVQDSLVHIEIVNTHLTHNWSHTTQFHNIMMGASEDVVQHDKSQVSVEHNSSNDTKQSNSSVVSVDSVINQLERVYDIYRRGPEKCDVKSLVKSHGINDMLTNFDYDYNATGSYRGIEFETRKTRTWLREFTFIHDMYGELRRIEIINPMYLEPETKFVLRKTEN